MNTYQILTTTPRKGSTDSNKHMVKCEAYKRTSSILNCSIWY